MSKKTLSVVIIAGNEQEMIKDCLLSCSWADSIILVAANSSDKTVSIAKSTIPDIKIIYTKDEYNKHFSKWRNLGLKQVTTPWLFYLDADERITPQLKQELLSTTAQKFDPHALYAVPRHNFYLGHRVKHGGSYPDYVKRLFQKKLFQGFTGKLHEEPQISGPMAHLKSPLLHLTHRCLSSMLTKTISWTDMEAREIDCHGHPPVVWWRILRMMATKFHQRLLKQQMWRDGTVGWISAIFETFDTFIIYARLWEIQQQKSSPKSD